MISRGKKQIPIIRLIILFEVIALCSSASTAVLAEEASRIAGPDELDAFFDDVVPQLMEENGIIGFTISVVKDGDIVFSKGYGYADAEHQVPVDAGKHLFAIGSTTKVFTWTAIMQLYEEGRLDLHEDVNAYLDFNIPDTYPGQPITLWHLMTHTAGFEARTFELSAYHNEDLSPLGIWLKTHLPARVRPPGAAPSYSNYGAALAGYIVERVSGVPFDEYVKHHIFQPLEMDRTSLGQPVPDHLASGLATGYVSYKGELQPAPRVLFHTTPSGAAVSTSEDMARFMTAFLQNGRYRDVRVLQEATAVEMKSRTYAIHPALNGIAYGIYEMSPYGAVDVIGHDGFTGTFSTRMALLPEKNIGLFISTTNNGGHLEIFSAFIKHYYPFYVYTVEPLPGSTDRAKEVAGEYRNRRGSYTTVESLVSVLGTTIQKVAANNDGSIDMPPVRIKYFEMEPYVFLNEEGQVLVFIKDRDGNINEMYMNLNPLESYERLPWYETSLFTRILVMVISGLFASFLVDVPLVFFLGRHKKTADCAHRRGRNARVLLGIAAGLGLLFMISLFTLLNSESISYGNVALLKAALVLPPAMIPFLIAAAYYSGVIWKDGCWSILYRIHYTLVTTAAALFIWFTAHWHLIGWQF